MGLVNMLGGKAKTHRPDSRTGYCVSCLESTN